MKLAAAALAAMIAATPAMAETLPPQRIFESPDISGPRARGVKLSPDGKAVTYIKTRADDLTVSDLWVADVAGGEPRRLLDGKQLAPRPRRRGASGRASPPAAWSTTPGTAWAR